MALAHKITKEAHAALPEGVKEHYTESEGGFVLDVTGGPDIGAMSRAKDREVQRNAELTKKLADVEAEHETLKRSANVSDIATLEKQHQAKVAELTSAHEKETATYREHISSGMVESAATSLATSITKSPALLMPHIKSRMSVEFGDKGPELVIKKQDGSANMTLDELQAEFVANPDFSAIIKASDASGGTGKRTNTMPRGRADGGSDTKPVDLSKLSPAEMAAHIDAARASE